MNNAPPHIFRDTRDGLLHIQNCFTWKEALAVIGAKYDPSTHSYQIVFCEDTVEKVLNILPPETTVAPELEGQILDYRKRVGKLEVIRAESKANKPIQFDIPGIKLPLYDYQKHGVKFGITNGCNLLIGDSMGLGKTIQSIALATYLKSIGRISNCLVITPASLKWNWPLEIEKFTDETFVVIDGDAEKRLAQWLDPKPFFKIVNYELVDDLFARRKIEINPEDKQDVRLKKAERKLKAAVRQKVLTDIRENIHGLVIIDEAHYCKGIYSQRTQNVFALKSKYHVALTGTPLDGRAEELYVIMSWVAPGLLSSRKKFFDRYVRTGFHSTDILGYKNLDELNQKIQPFFIRRLKSEVLDLPPKSYVNRVLELTPEERKIYTALAHGEHEVTKDAEMIVRAIRCKQFLNLPAMVDQNCTRSTKLDDFKNVVDELCVDNAEKIIVFEESTKMLDALEPTLKGLGLKWLRIDGDTDLKLRADYQEVFNTDPSINAIICSNAGANGLNLTGASRVLMYSASWSPSIQSQREDRCYRIGQKNPVTVINFLVKDSIESRIREVLYSKESVSNDVLGDGTDEATLMKLGASEISKLLL